MPSCPQCGATFNPASHRQRFCASACQIKHANQRRASTRSGRRTGMTPTAPPQKFLQGRSGAQPVATAANLFGQWFVRVDGWLALGPMNKARAQGAC